MGVYFTFDGQVFSELNSLFHAKDQPDYGLPYQFVVNDRYMKK